jgi:PilZ domain
VIRSEVGGNSVQDRTPPTWRWNMRRAPARNQTTGETGPRLRRSMPSRVTRFQAQRQVARTVLNCQVYYSGINVQGEGVIRNISLHGCQIEGSITVRPGIKLSLVVVLSNSPLVVDRAAVVWSDDNRFGLRHELLLPTERTQLETFLEGSDTRPRIA